MGDQRQVTEGVSTTPLRRIPVMGGDVYHGMKVDEPGYAGFGEVYFSEVKYKYVKGWKRHNRATLNFVVPHGEVQVAVYDDATNRRDDFRMGPRTEASYFRLTIAPGLWVAFGGLSQSVNLLLNLSSIPHDPLESASRNLADHPWQWLEH